MSVNKVILIGNLGADPETKYLTNGDAVSNVRLATSESWKDKTSGERKEVTEWHRVVFFRKLAEIVDQYLKKGATIYVEGRIKTRKWQDKDGQDRYTTEIEATEMKMLGKPSGRGSDSDAPSDTGGSKPAPKRDPGANPSFDDMDEDIPF